jgi:hypothetical protein
MAIVQQTLMYDNLIEFRKTAHQYFSRKDGTEFKSVTKGLKSLKEPFDADGIAFAIAKKEIGWDSTDFKRIAKRKDEIKEEWRLKGENAATYGTMIHAVYEEYRKTGRYDPKYKNLIEQTNAIVEGSYHVFSERIFYSEKHKMAGTGDLSTLRQKGKFPVMDFFDFKTNIEKGIVFDSIKREDNVITKHYNRYLLYPVDYLENCNYTEYALQLSIYAYMAQVTYGIKVGRLAILFIDSEYNVEQIPVPYMRMEAELVLEHASGLKSVSEVLSDQYHSF